MSCCGVSQFAALSRAAARSAAGGLRRLGLLPEAVDWARRAAACEACPLRTIHKGVSYCGRPFLQQIDRVAADHGCGCPTRDKAKAAEEHCPVDSRLRPAAQVPTGCTCKWCNLTTR